MCVADGRRKQSTLCWLFQSGCPASPSQQDRHVDGQFIKGPPVHRYPTAFFSASAIVTKALLRKAILNFVCFLFYGYHYCYYFVVPVDVFSVQMII